MGPGVSTTQALMVAGSSGQVTGAGRPQSPAGHSATRNTSTGQWALATQCSLTEPRSMPANSPWPRLPTTSRSAPLEASTSSGAGWPSATLGSMVTAG